MEGKTQTLGVRLSGGENDWGSSHFLGVVGSKTIHSINDYRRGQPVYRKGWLGQERPPQI
jgi:hypothetical protein